MQYEIHKINWNLTYLLLIDMLHNFGEIKLSTKSSTDLGHRNYLCTGLLPNGPYFYKTKIFKGKYSPSSLFKPSCCSFWEAAAVTLAPLLAPGVPLNTIIRWNCALRKLPHLLWKSGSSKNRSRSKQKLSSAGHAKTEVEKTQPRV